LSFRGTFDHGFDWFYNTNIDYISILIDNQKILIHKGFYNNSFCIFKKLGHLLINILAKTQLNLILCGHSLGAAMSNVFYILLYKLIKDLDKNELLNRINVYGFATPPNISFESINYINLRVKDKINNFVDSLDVVTYGTLEEHKCGIAGNIYQISNNDAWLKNELINKNKELEDYKLTDDNYLVKNRNIGTFFNLLTYLEEKGYNENFINMNNLIYYHGMGQYIDSLLYIAYNNGEIDQETINKYHNIKFDEIKNTDTKNLDQYLDNFKDYLDKKIQIDETIKYEQLNARPESLYL